MSRDQSFPTAIQNIALNLVFGTMGESRFNRSQREYAAIAAKLPPLKMLTFDVNARLNSIHEQSEREGDTIAPNMSLQAWRPKGGLRRISTANLR